MSRLPVFSLSLSSPSNQVIRFYKLVSFTSSTSICLSLSASAPSPQRPSLSRPALCLSPALSLLSGSGRKRESERLHNKSLPANPEFHYELLTHADGDTGPQIDRQRDRQSDRARAWQDSVWWAIPPLLLNVSSVPFFNPMARVLMAPVERWNQESCLKEKMKPAAVALSSTYSCLTNSTLVCAEWRLMAGVPLPICNFVNLIKFFICIHLLLPTRER